MKLIKILQEICSKKINEELSNEQLADKVIKTYKLTGDKADEVKYILNNLDKTTEGDSIDKLVQITGDSRGNVMKLLNSVDEDVKENTSHSESEGDDKKYQSLWIASSKDKKGDWESAPQKELKDTTWGNAVKVAKELAKKQQSEIRLSTTKGYNNQGYYFHHQSLQESATWNKLTANLKD